MIHHATSHSMSVFVCSILGAFLVEMSKPLWPQAHQFLVTFSLWIQERLELPVSLPFLTIVIAAAGLAFIWGAIFRLLRS